MIRFLLLLLALLPTLAHAQQSPLEGGQYLYRSLADGEDTLLYRMLLPADFMKNKAYPLVLFLHGAGERGADNEKQLAHGSQLFLDSLSTYPAIVIFPQCPRDDYWANLNRVDEGGSWRKFDFNYTEGPTTSMRLVLQLIDQMLAEPYVNEDRFYVSGLSMGGMGTWELLWRIPEKIAAAIPICGGGHPQTAHKMQGVPIWAIHGVKDDVVHPRYSVIMNNAVQRAGGTSKITLYPDANHNSWDAAFAEPDFLAWLFSKSKTTSDQ